MLFCPCSSHSPHSAEAEFGKPLEDLVKKAVSQIIGDKRLSEEGVRGAWTKAAGARAAKHSRPVSLRRSRLVVNVDGSSWLYELTLKKREIMEKLGGRFLGRQLKDIRFRIGEVI